MQLVEGLGLVRWYKNLRRSARFWWRLNHRWWWIIRRNIPYGFIQESRCPYLLWTWTGSFSGLLCLCDMLQSWFALLFLILMWSRIWSSWQFRIWSRSCSWWRCSLRRIGNFFRWSYNFSCCLSRVGLSALLSLVMSVCVSTEVKMVLVTLAHDLAIQTNLRASGYAMFLSTFIDWIALLCKIDSL
jgi:hypothetical protein